MKLCTNNSSAKIQEDWVVIFKILSHKIVQESKGAIWLAREMLCTITLKEHNYKVEKIGEDMQHKVKLLNCGEEEVNSLLPNIFSHV